jgi:hypothetical protein
MPCLLSASIRRGSQNAHARTHEVRKAYDDGVETGGLPGGDVARAVVKEHLRCEGATMVIFFFATGKYSPFFIKKSELQVSYERTLIAQITNH